MVDASQCPPGFASESESTVKSRDCSASWFVLRRYKHFDAPISLADAKAYVSNPANIVRHEFLPLLRTERTRRTLRRDGGKLRFGTKSRVVNTASHVDSHIFAWYSKQLAGRYEAELSRLGLGRNVLAFRTGQKTTVHMARHLFTDVASRDGCIAIAADLRAFFDTIPHAELKRAWAGLLGADRLPPDHFAVYRALTRYAQIDRKLYQHLASIGLQRGRPRYMLGTLKELRELTRCNPDLKTVRDARCGVPQGVSLSAVLSNVIMLGFDVDLENYATSHGGVYRRYADDILLVLPADANEADALRVIGDALHAAGPTLELNDQKTEVVRFERQADGTLRSSTTVGLQYLGFTFDGQKILIRSQTLSRYARSMAYAVAAAKRSSLGTGTPPYRRAIYRRFTALGRSNFVSGYARLARALMPGDDIRRQMRRHFRRVATLFGR